ncbi:MAG: hypothetical protein WCJ56_11445 [bacterium]
MTNDFAGTVQVPAGASSTSNTVVTGMGSTPVAKDGTFSVPVITGGTQMGMVTDAAGDIILLGWLTGQKSTINARTTAEVLIYQATGCGSMLPSLRQQAMDLLAVDGDVNAVRDVIIAVEAAGMARPLVDARITAAVTAYIDKQRSMSSVKGTSGARNIWLLEPGELSGVNVLTSEEGFNNIEIRQKYRRRCKAVISRLNYVDLVGGASHIVAPDQQLMQSVAIDMPNGLNGGISGAISDIVINHLTSTPQAYSERATGPIEAPLYPNSDTAKTSAYRVCVVGPGAITAGGLSAIEEAELKKVCEDALINDFIFPLFSTVILNATGSAMGNQPDAFPEAAGDVVQDVMSLFTTIPAIEDAAKVGDLKTMMTTVMGAIMTNNTLRTALIKKIIATRITDTIKQKTAADAAGKFLLGLDIGLFVFDHILRNWQYEISNAASTWTFTSTHPVVDITPKISNVKCYGDDVALTVTLAELKPGEDPAGIGYQYLCDDALGTIAVDGKTGTDISSTSKYATFISNNSGKSGDVTLTVKAYKLDGGVNHYYLGKATATISVGSTYTLYSDGAGGYFNRPDDDVNVYLNGKQIFDDHDHMPLSIPPITFKAKKGDQLRITLSDNGGSWGIGPTFLRDDAGHSAQISGTHGSMTPTSNTTSTIMWETTYTIPW